MKIRGFRGVPCRADFPHPVYGKSLLAILRTHHQNRANFVFCFIIFSLLSASETADGCGLCIRKNKKAVTQRRQKR